MSRLGRVRKAVAAALGFAAFYIVLVPDEMVPEQWRPWVGLVLAAAGVAGVYKAPPNDTPPLPTRVARPDERPRRGLSMDVPPPRGSAGHGPPEDYDG